MVVNFLIEINLPQQDDVIFQKGTEQLKTKGYAFNYDTKTTISSLRIIFNVDVNLLLCTISQTKQNEENINT